MADINKLIGELAQEVITVKPAPHPFILSTKWMAGAAAYLALALLISGTRADLMAKFQEPLFALEVAALLGLFVATSISAALLSYPDMHQMRHVAYTPFATLALLVLVMLLAWRADVPPVPSPIHGFQCTIELTLLSLLPIAWMFYAMRKFASTHLRWAGSIALLFAFSIGALWLRLAEQTDSTMHLIQWHYLPVIAFGIAGLWLGKTLLKW